MDLHQFYNQNSDFRRFCDKALINHDADNLDALFSLKLVQEVAKEYSYGGCNCQKEKNSVG